MARLEAVTGLGARRGVTDPRELLRALLDVCPGEQVSVPRAWLLPLLGDASASRGAGIPVTPPEPTADRLLDVETAAVRLGVTAAWLYRHWREIPTAVKLGRRTLRFSEAGLERYLAARRRSTGRAA